MDAHFAHMARMSSWQFVAARDGAMTIFHFGKAMNNINMAAQQCPSFIPLIDAEKRREASKLFAKHFPNNAAVRHAVAHSAEMAARPEDHGFTGSYDNPGLMKAGYVENLMMSSVLMNRTFTLTYEGEIFSYEISAQTLATLRAIKNLLYLAYAPVEKYCAELKEQKWRERVAAQARTSQSPGDQTPHQPKSPDPAEGRRAD